MDSFFGIGFPELVLILLLAGIVMGPQRIRQVARWLGRTTAQLQVISREFTRQLNAELDSVDETGDIKGAMQDVQELRRQVADLRRELGATSMGLSQEGDTFVRENRDLVKRTIDPRPQTTKPNGATEPASPTVPPSPANLPKPIEVPDDPE